MDGSSATFDVRNLPELPATANRDEVSEHHHGQIQRQGTEAFAAIGSGVGTQAVPAPSPLTSFEGLSFNEDCNGSQCGDGHPPDTNGDVGPTYYIQTINTSIGIYDKSTGARRRGIHLQHVHEPGQLRQPVRHRQFRRSGRPLRHVRGPLDHHRLRVPARRRRQRRQPPGAYQCFAVSQTGDPVAGGWNFYSIHVTDGLNDYPKLGIWPDGLYMSANMFGFGAPAALPERPRLGVQQGRRCTPGARPQVVTFNVATSRRRRRDFTLLPSNARAADGHAAARDGRTVRLDLASSSTRSTSRSSTSTGTASRLDVHRARPTPSTGTSWRNVGPGTCPEPAATTWTRSRSG